MYHSDEYELGGVNKILLIDENNFGEKKVSRKSKKSRQEMDTWNDTTGERSAIPSFHERRKPPLKYVHQGTHIITNYNYYVKRITLPHKMATDTT